MAAPEGRHTNRPHRMVPLGVRAALGVGLEMLKVRWDGQSHFGPISSGPGGMIFGFSLQEDCPAHRGPNLLFGGRTILGVKGIEDRP